MQNMTSTDTGDAAKDPFDEIRAYRQKLGHFCSGVGLEIGPLHIPTEGVAPESTVLYMDRVSTNDLIKYFENNPGIPTEAIVPIDVIGDAMTVPFGEGRLDFLVANHVLEHLANPLKALKEWHRCLKEGGILYLSLPDKRFCSFRAENDEWIFPDRGRQLTTWQHLLDDFRRDDKGDSKESREHARDVLRHVERVPEDEIEGRVDQFLGSEPDYHYHTWTFESLLGAVDRCSRELGLGWRLEAQLASYETWGEMIVIFRKDSSARSLLPVAHRYPELDIGQLDVALGELLPGTLCEQSFTIKLESLNAIDVRFATFNRPNAGTVVFRLRADELPEPLAEQHVNASELEDNRYHRFEFAAVPAAGRKFRFTLEARDSTPGQAVTVWCARTDDPSLHLIVNGAQQPGLALNFKAFATRVLEQGSAWSDATPGESTQGLEGGAPGGVGALARKVRGRLQRLLR